MWSKANHAPHDFWGSDQGKIYALTVQKFNETQNYYIMHDQITILQLNEQRNRNISLIDSILNSNYRGLYQEPIFSGNYARLDRKTKIRVNIKFSLGDVLHTITLKLLATILQGPNPQAFSLCKALVYFNNLNTISLVKLDSEEIEWSLTGMFRSQHDPELLQNGNLLIFDNNSENGKI